MAIVGRCSLRALLVLTALVAGLVAPVVGTGTPVQASPTRAGAWTPPPENPDADLVIILPAVGKGAFERQRAALQPWLDDLGLSYSLVPLSSIVRRHKDLASLTAQQVRDHLRSHYTARLSTEAQPRYLGIFAPPTAGYLDPDRPRARFVPRFDVRVGSGEPFGSDVPYGVLGPATIDGGDGTVEPIDLDVTQPTFEVFRVPVTSRAGIRTFVRRHDRFMASEHRSDVTLASGEIGLFPGDSSVVQCISATMLTSVVPSVLKVLDSTASCSPDVLTSASGPRLADVLADPGGPFHGGTIVNVSHGNATSIAAGQRTNGVMATFRNLEVADVASIPPDRLNVFISIACDNDAPTATGINLAAAMYQGPSVAVVSATTVVTPVAVADILYAEVESIAALFQHDETLLQRMHTFRSEYFQRFVRPASGPVRDLLWTNVLTVGVTGDGLVSVAP